MTNAPEIRFGDGSANEHCRACIECGSDCLPEPFDRGNGVRAALLFPERGVHSILDTPGA